jgi:hypothetical protein
VLARACLDALGDLRASEDAQDTAMVSIVEAFTAAARGHPEEALWHARATLSFADTLGMTADNIRWAWPLAARTAWELGDTAVATELLRVVDHRQPGQLSPLLWAERDLARARLAAQAGAADSATFATAIRGLRDHGTPYHLAHGLLDHAELRTKAGDFEAAAQAVDEARQIAVKLRCQPLLDRADGLACAPDSLPV